MKKCKIINKFKSSKDFKITVITEDMKTLSAWVSPQSPVAEKNEGSLLFYVEEEMSPAKKAVAEKLGKQPAITLVLPEWTQFEEVSNG
jgi:hypothetical protein